MYTGGEGGEGVLYSVQVRTGGGGVEIYGFYCIHTLWMAPIVSPIVSNHYK